MHSDTTGVLVILSACALSAAIYFCIVVAILKVRRLHPLRMFGLDIVAGTWGLGTLFWFAFKQISAHWGDFSRSAAYPVARLYCLCPVYSCLRGLVLPFYTNKIELTSALGLLLKRTRQKGSGRM
jgi:hypothetical protein